MIENIIRILTTNSFNRTFSEKQSLYTYFLSFTFFANLQAQDESGSTYKSCMNSLIIEKHSTPTILPSGIYILLSGSAQFSNPKPEKLPKFLKVHGQLNLSAFETISFQPGTIFGQLHKSEFYALFISEPCIIAALHLEVYNEILNKHEEIHTEKLEFLNKLEIFKSWSRQAVKNVAKAFEKLMFRKGMTIYKENDTPEFIYLVLDGEIKLTQNFVVSLEAKEKTHRFGMPNMTKYRTAKSLLKKTNLQVVLKQKGEMFGHNEFINKSEKREFSAICESNHAILLVMTEKEFFKKFSHPETLRVLEEQNNLFTAWKLNRLVNLKSTESYKVRVSHTPSSQLRVVRRGETPTPDMRRKHVESPDNSRLPKIIKKFIQQSEGRADRSVVIFSTELSVDCSRGKKYFRG